MPIIRSALKPIHQIVRLITLKFVIPYISSHDIKRLKRNNACFKSRILMFMGLLFFSTSIIFSYLSFFSVSNYDSYAESSNLLNLYTSLHRRFFKSKDFLSSFKDFNSNKNAYIDYLKSIGHGNTDIFRQNLYFEPFHYNLSKSAHLNYLINVYKENDDPAKYLSENLIPFHWGNWLDLSKASPIVQYYDSLLKTSNLEHVEKRFQDAIIGMCTPVLTSDRKPWIDNQEYEANMYIFEELENVGICASLYLIYFWPIPERILFENDYNYFNIPIQQKKSPIPLTIKELSKLYGEEPKEFIGNFNNLEDKIDSLLDIYKEKVSNSEKISLSNSKSAPKSSFAKPNVDEIYLKYLKMTDRSPMDEKYYRFLNYSKHNAVSNENFNHNRIFFSTANIQTDQGLLAHYTFPWVQRILSSEERIVVIHHLSRSWFKFAEQAGVISWFNYGNAIGWYFNSMNLPWDNDIDVQLSIADLDNLGKKFNNTLIVEDPKLGDRLFWFQTGPYYLQENIHQYIDARYIDVKTGCYIDITALWYDVLESSKDPTVFTIHCKHNNWFSYDDIFPLKRTLFEGAQAYMVRNIRELIYAHYGSHPFKQVREKGHNWQPDIGLWIPDNICPGFFAQRKNKFDENGDLTIRGACGNEELQELYRKIKPAWEIHKKEIELLEKGQDTTELSKESLPIFRYYDHEDYR